MSEFQKMLDGDLELRKRCDELMRKHEDAIAPLLEEIQRSEQLTAEDLSIVINART